MTTRMWSMFWINEKVTNISREPRRNRQGTKNQFRRGRELVNTNSLYQTININNCSVIIKVTIVTKICIIIYICSLYIYPPYVPLYRLSWKAVSLVSFGFWFLFGYQLGQFPVTRRDEVGILRVGEVNLLYNFVGQ